MSRELEGKVYLVTGGRRGIGAEIVKGLASRGANIVVNYVDESLNKLKRNNVLEKEVKELGGDVRFVQADITNPGDREFLLAETMEEVIWTTGQEKLAGAFWNAAGGLEEDKPEGWPELINTEANLELAKSFSKIMEPDSLQIFVTSLWSQKYGQVKQLPFYRPVARTKYQAEKQLRNLSESGEIEGKFGVLCGHVVTDTGAYSLLKKNFSERLESLEKLAKDGKFPSAFDMGQAALKMVLEGYEKGNTVYVGGEKAEPIDPGSLEEVFLNRKQIRRKFPMYSNSRILVDGFTSPGEDLDSKGKEFASGYYVVRSRDTLGHFTGDYKDIKLWRGVDRIESAAQALGLTYLSLEPKSKFVPLFIGGGEYDFPGVVTPWEKVEITTELTAMTPRGIRGNVEMKVGNETVTTVKGLKLVLAPNKETAKRLIQNQISKRQKVAKEFNHP